MNHIHVSELLCTCAVAFSPYTFTTTVILGLAAHFNDGSIMSSASQVV
jgi:hypothetical protein